LSENKTKHTGKIIQISGPRGLLMLLIAAVYLFAGFVSFPANLAMSLWNRAAEFIGIPFINVYQGLLLWLIVVILLCLSNAKYKSLIAFRNINGLNDEELKQILDNIKSKTDT